MNSGTNFVLILSLLLALAMGSSAMKERKNEESDPTSPSRIAINHNETMLSVAAPAYAWRDWLADIQALFLSRPTGGGCDEWGCGGNHNETMLSDTAPVLQALMLSDLLTSIRTFLFDRPTPGGCDEFGCGMNHNETMLSDVAPVHQASMF